MKYCKDCKHAIFKELPRLALCSQHPHVIDDVIYGHSEKLESCKEQRSLRGHCGPEAKLWESKWLPRVPSID